MEIPEVKHTEQAQRIKHVQLGGVIYAVDDILKIHLHKQENPAAYRGTVYLKSLTDYPLPFEEVIATVVQYKIMQEVMCGGVT